MGVVRVLVTGFGPFPGAPVNPTEHLIEHWRKTPPDLPAETDLRLAVLPVDFALTAPALEEAVGGFDPHIAIHFGLAGDAAGFRLERLARNATAADQPDTAGICHPGGTIAEGLSDQPSRLPLEAMAAQLAAAHLPVEWSDDAGGYLCNQVFFQSAAGLCAGLNPTTTGFIHVPPPEAMAPQDLERGARIIVDCALRSGQGMP